MHAALHAADTKRLMDLELQLHKSCSVPFGFAAVTLPGAAGCGALPVCACAGLPGWQQKALTLAMQASAWGPPHTLIIALDQHRLSCGTEPTVSAAAAAPAA